MILFAKWIAKINKTEKEKYDAKHLFPVLVIKKHFKALVSQTDTVPQELMKIQLSFQQTLIFFIFTEKWRSFCSVSCAKQHSAEKCWIIVKGFVILTFCSCKFLIGAALCGCADTRKHKEIETYSPCCSLWLLKVSIRNCPQPERSQIFIIPTDNMLSKQPCILSKCPWISLRTPACSLIASHSEYEHQLNASNANAYYFSLKSDTAKMMKLYLVVVIF